jgi:(p)ppGpp synthase/HD superfamily hydrolase
MEDNYRDENYKDKQAERLAIFMHHGQKRRGGEDFVEHPRHVADAIKKLGYGEDVVCAAWLHDSEDFPHLNIIYSLIDRVFGYKVFGLVLLLTHTKGIPYNDYVYKIARTSDEAMAIKFQDMIDNTVDVIPMKQKDKYRNACLFLQSKGIEIPEILKERLKI